jgi:excinuclease ABC subunit A
MNSQKKSKQAAWINIIGAREHNLKNIDVAIPKDTLTIITGPSGSGKSSLALDILYTEGKRRYMESLSSYARQFLGIPKKPDVDRIEGLCPSIAIEQKTVGANPRSTVGTITELYDYLRVLFARIGRPHCASCHVAIEPADPERITQMMLERFNDQHILIAAPIVHEKKGEFKQELAQLFTQGMYRFIIDGQQYRFKNTQEIEALQLKKTMRHSIDLLVDQMQMQQAERSRLQEAIETAFARGNNSCKIIVGEQEYRYSSERICITCAQSVPELEPRLFSFNSPIGACPECHGLGITHAWSWADQKDAWKEEYPEFFAQFHAAEQLCRSCNGKRLNAQALAVTLAGANIFDLCQLSLQDLQQFFATLSITSTEQEIAATLLQEIANRIKFLVDVGLGYLSLNRTARSLSGGEGQRIRLATQIGSALSGVLYVLDEPSIGLHQRDNDRLIETLKALRDQGNTVVVVEHDTDTMRQADYIIDMGPAAGVLGGQITAVGAANQLEQQSASLTGAYLAGKKSIPLPQQVRQAQGHIALHNVSRNNLKQVDVQIPLGLMCGISGVSGSGKSTLIMQELVPYMRAYLDAPAQHEQQLAVQNMVVIDQTPIGRTPRSNPATYLGLFDDIRKLFAALPESRVRGYQIGRFSFNVATGRCFECNGDGVIKVTMHFLPEVTMICKACKGKRYNSETLQISYKNKNIADVLDMTAYEALAFFKAHSTIAKRLQLMCDVGLDYLKLGQPSTTLSGGEAQRIKLVHELAKRGRQTLYILDEPTTGLHTHDIAQLLKVLNALVDKGNSMIIIEHNLDVIKTLDWLIDLGPEGGQEGGRIIAQGTPVQVAQVHTSYTGRYLKPFFHPKPQL